MNKLIIPFIFISCLFVTACSDDDEPVVLDNIVGEWSEVYPHGLQTEGFVTWDFSNSTDMTIRVCDVFAGDFSYNFNYTLSGEKKTITIAGDINNSDGATIRDNLVVYEVVKLTKKELRIKQSWINPHYEELASDNNNIYYFGGLKELSFKR